MPSLKDQARIIYRDINNYMPTHIRKSAERIIYSQIGGERHTQEDIIKVRAVYSTHYTRNEYYHI